MTMTDVVGELTVHEICQAREHAAGRSGRARPSARAIDWATNRTGAGNHSLTKPCLSSDGEYFIGSLMNPENRPVKIKKAKAK